MSPARHVRTIPLPSAITVATPPDRLAARHTPAARHRPQFGPIMKPRLHNWPAAKPAATQGDDRPHTHRLGTRRTGTRQSRGLPPHILPPQFGSNSFLIRGKSTRAGSARAEPPTTGSARAGSARAGCMGFPSTFSLLAPTHTCWPARRRRNHRAEWRAWPPPTAMRGKSFRSVVAAPWAPARSCWPLVDACESQSLSWVDDFSQSWKCRKQEIVGGR